MSQQEEDQNTSILFRCIIPGRVGIKKNNRRIISNYGRRFLLCSEHFLNWEMEAKHYVKQAMVNLVDVPITCLLHA